MEREQRGPEWTAAGSGWYLISVLLGLLVGVLLLIAVNDLFRPEDETAWLVGVAAGVSVGALHASVGKGAEKIFAAIAEKDLRRTSGRPGSAG